VALLPPELLTMLARLGLRTGRRGTGLSGGTHRSKRRGISQEFADHRPYVPGDDIRFLDWHVYGRLDALWVKRFEEEEDRVVQLLLDTSASMEGEKLAYAQQLSAALAFVALGADDRVAVGAIAERLVAYHAPRRGRAAASAVFSSIEEVHPGGTTDIGKGVDGWPRQQGSGLALLFTDLLYPDGPDLALRRLLSRGNDVHVFHLVVPADLRPALSGDVVLVDAETGEELAATIDDEVLDAYEATVRAWADEMAQTCARLGCGYTRVLTSSPVQEVLLGDLRRAGVVS
jgi:uncharacterized protein (DUF58 family)